MLVGVSYTKVWFKLNMISVGMIGSNTIFNS